MLEGVTFGHPNYDEDSPESPGFGDLADKLMTRASDLAEADRGDDAAVEELRAMAGRKRTALKEAAWATRQLGEHHYFEVPNLANRLLLAAFDARSVEPVSPDDARRMQRMDEFLSRSGDEQWRVLTDRHPELVDLEQPAREGVFGLRPASAIGLSGAASREQAQKRLLMYDRLTPLVGPKSGDDDDVCSSYEAFEFAGRYLSSLAPE